ETGAKFATTLLFAFMVTATGFALPPTSPLQFAKAKPVAAVAVNVTTVPAAYDCWFGLRATLPEPVTLVVNVKGPAVAAVKVAVTVRFALIVIVCGFAAPVRSPLQPEKTKPAAGVAVSVTTVPAA